MLHCAVHFVRLSLLSLETFRRVQIIFHFSKSLVIEIHSTSYKWFRTNGFDYFYFTPFRQASYFHSSFNKYLHWARAGGKYILKPDTLSVLLEFCESDWLPYRRLSTGKTWFHEYTCYLEKNTSVYLPYLHSSAFLPLTTVNTRIYEPWFGSIRADQILICRVLSEKSDWNCS